MGITLLKLLIKNTHIMYRHNEHIHIHPSTYININIQTHTHTCTRTHAHTHAHTHSHTQSVAQLQVTQCFNNFDKVSHLTRAEVTGYTTPTPHELSHISCLGPNIVRGYLSLQLRFWIKNKKSQSKPELPFHTKSYHKVV